MQDKKLKKKKTIIFIFMVNDLCHLRFRPATPQSEKARIKMAGR
jgi:hypothetical protein